MNRELPATTITRIRAVLATAILAAASVVLLTLIDAGPAGAASSGGISTFQPSPATGDREVGKYDRLWERVSIRDRRWARNTAECESGGDPRAIGSGGTYRGAFQFMRSTWKSAPRSPGGDPIVYSYKTQAVVAIALKNRDGTSHWPVCG